MTTMPSNAVYFGPYEVTDQVFYKTSLSYALVNIKPILPGHVLVIPLRRVKRLTCLSTMEVTDLFLTVQKVQKMLALTYFKPNGAMGEGSFNIAIQDGKESGQTVEHMHCHIIPRVKADGVEGDAIYDRLQGEEGNVGGGLWDTEMERRVVARPAAMATFPDVEDEMRKPRSKEDMDAEAKIFRKQMEWIESKAEEV